MNPSKTPESPVTQRYLEHFKPAEFRFRWVEATGLDRNLPARANHLASRLGALWVDVFTVSTTYDELSRISRQSLRTVQRAIADLTDYRWIAINREGALMHVTLILDDRGLDLLLEERERRAGFAGRRQINEDWARRVYGQILSRYGQPAVDYSPEGKWRILYSKIRSMVSHMVCPETETLKLIEELTEAPPTQITDLPGFLLSRAATHIRNHPHLGRATKVPTSRPHSATDGSPLDDLLNGYRPRTLAEVLNARPQS